MPRFISHSSAKALDAFPVPSRRKSAGDRKSAPLVPVPNAPTPTLAASAASAAPASVPSVPTLSAKDITALSRAREGRWQPGLASQPLHSEIFADSSDASGAGFALALARDAWRRARQDEEQMRDPIAPQDDLRHILWVQDKRAIQRGGRPYIHGLPPEMRGRLIHVEAATPQDALFAMEEGLRCRDLACVIGEIAGNSRALDFTASRRLSLAAEKHGTALWLVRLEAQADLSSARMRWRVEAAPSAPPMWNAAAPGAPAWKAELFRAAHHAPGKWTLNDDKGRLCTNRPWYAANSQNLGHLVRPTVGRSLAAVARI